jgi:hypothetical protein
VSDAIVKSTTIRRVKTHPDGSETAQQYKALVWKPEQLHRAFKRLGLLDREGKDDK